MSLVRLVTVKLRDYRQTSITDDTGRWAIELPAQVDGRAILYYNKRVYHRNSKRYLYWRCLDCRRAVKYGMEVEYGNNWC